MLNKKRLSFSILFCGFFFCCLQSSAQEFISVKGKEIIGKDQKPFLIRGTNLGNWLLAEGYMFKFDKPSSELKINEVFLELIGPVQTKNFWTQFQKNYVQEADIKFLKSTGINTLRVPFSYQVFTAEDYMGSSDSSRGFRLLDSLTSWCKKAAIYLILDLHAAPGGQTGANIDNGYGYPYLYEDQSNLNQTVQLWKKIANHFKNESQIMGYDLLNEPIDPYFKRFNKNLEPLYKEITRAIRSVDSKHLVFLGGAQWDSNFDPFGPPFDSKSVYTFHKYWMPVEQKAIQPYLDFRDKYNVPIYCGETGENKDPWIHDFKELLEKNNIGWTYWPYKKMENLSGFLSFPKPTGYDSVIAYAEKNRSSFAQIRAESPLNREVIKTSIFQVTANCLFENCNVNTSYINALGLKPPIVGMPQIQGLEGLAAKEATIQKISSQFSFTEGPAVDKEGNIFFTDQPNDKIWEYSSAGKLSVFMDQARRANGMYFDHFGNLIVCADEKYQLLKISPEKKITVMVENFQQHALNGPNDLWIDKKGGIYITDPYYQRPYWLRKHPDLTEQSVYYLKEGSKNLVLAANGLKQPNGIVGSADGKILYVSDIGDNKTYAYSITADGKLINKQLLFNQGSDGMTLDNHGNIYITGNGVSVYSSKGEKLGHIDIPENWTSNVCFGGRGNNTLFITASKSIFTLPMLVQGIE